MTDCQNPASDEPPELRAARIVAMKDGGASWKDIQEVFSLTRQQARYAYQLGKRAERRRRRPGDD